MATREWVCHDCCIVWKPNQVCVCGYRPPCSSCGKEIEEGRVKKYRNCGKCPPSARLYEATVFGNMRAGGEIARERKRVRDDENPR